MTIITQIKQARCIAIDILCRALVIPIMQSKGQMENLDYEVNSYGISNKLRPLVNNRELLLHFFDAYDTEFNDDDENSDWKDFLYLCHELQGKCTYYYSHIKESKTGTAIEIDKVLPFKKYKDNARAQR